MPDVEFAILESQIQPRASQAVSVESKRQQEENSGNLLVSFPSQAHTCVWMTVST
jgi:hypothetical protein